MKLLLILLFSFCSLFFHAQELQTLNVYFEFDQFELSLEEELKLRNWISEHTKVELITISAFTDTSGSIKYNEALAAKRLKTIVELFTINTSQIEKKVIGKNYPLTTSYNAQHFRKVELVYKPIHVVNEKVIVINEPQNSQDQRLEELKQERFQVFSAAGLDQTINLNIQFQNNSALYYDWDSAEQVYVLSEYLKEHPNYKAFLKGHVCCSASMDISIQRAFKVYQDLIRLGINKERLSYEGFSNTMPLVPETSQENQQMNRRVEVVFTE